MKVIARGCRPTCEGFKRVAFIMVGKCKSGEKEGDSWANV